MHKTSTFTPFCYISPYQNDCSFKMLILPRTWTQRHLIKDSRTDKETISSIKDSRTDKETISPRPTSRRCRTTVIQNTQLQWEQTNFDFAVGNVLCLMRIAHTRVLADTGHCPMLTLNSVCGPTLSDSRSGPLEEDVQGIDGQTDRQTDRQTLAIEARAYGYQHKHARSD